MLLAYCRTRKHDVSSKLAIFDISLNKVGPLDCSTRVNPVCLPNADGSPCFVCVSQHVRPEVHLAELFGCGDINYCYPQVCQETIADPLFFWSRNEKIISLSDSTINDLSLSLLHACLNVDF